MRYSWLLCLVCICGCQKAPEPVETATPEKSGRGAFSMPKIEATPSSQVQYVAKPKLSKQKPKEFLDLDGDGKISVFEAKRARIRLDLNGDGKFSFQERVLARPLIQATEAAMRNKALDTDGDGYVSDEERAAIRKAFDKNGDGQLDGEEMKQMQAHWRARTYEPHAYELLFQRR